MKAFRVVVRYETIGGHTKTLAGKIVANNKEEAEKKLQSICKKNPDFAAFIPEPETAEEAAKNYVKVPFETVYKDQMLIDAVYNAFLDGVKWSRKR